MKSLILLSVFFIFHQVSFSQGVEKIMDYPSSSASYHGVMLNIINDKLVYYVDDGINGNEVWVSNGHPSGTMLLKNINPITGSYGRDKAIELNNNLYFISNDGTNLGLWKTDGTPTNTQFVFAPGSEQLTKTGNKLFFAGSTASTGMEPYVSDGTTAGSMLLKDVNPGSSGSMWLYRPTGSLNGSFYFAAGDGSPSSVTNQLWKSDGTPTGTVMVKDFNPNDLSSMYSAFGDMIELNGELLMIARDGSTGMELWKTDGTTAGTVLVKDIVPGSTWGVYNTSSSLEHSLLKMGNYVYFQALNGGQGFELWKTDGTTAGTVLVKDINTNNNGSTQPHIGLLYVDGNTLYFSADNGTTGSELWKTDGTAAGTVMVKDLLEGGAGSSPHSFSKLGNGELLFHARYNSWETTLWRTDGTSEGTEIVKHYISETSGKEAMVVQDTMFFFSNNQNSSKTLWKYTPCIETYHTDSTAISQGDSIELGGGMQRTYGLYVDTLEANNGCDSIVTTTLCVTLKDTVQVAILEGDSIMLSGAYQSTGGDYSDTLKTTNGCDSVVVSHLCITELIVDSVSIPMGDSFYVHGAYQTVAGIYDDTTQMWNNCDRIYRTVLSFSTPIHKIQAELGVFIYPNPVKNKLTIDKGLVEELEVSIIDATGRILNQVLLNKQLNQIDLKDYPNGVYFLKCTDGIHWFSQKIIKQ